MRRFEHAPVDAALRWRAGWKQIGFLANRHGHFPVFARREHYAQWEDVRDNPPPVTEGVDGFPYEYPTPAPADELRGLR